MKFCTQLYGFKYYYPIWIIFKKIYLTTTLGQSERESNGKEVVLHTGQISKNITPPPDVV